MSSEKLRRLLLQVEVTGPRRDEDDLVSLNSALASNLKTVYGSGNGGCTNNTSCDNNGECSNNDCCYGNGTCKGNSNAGCTPVTETWDV